MLMLLGVVLGLQVTGLAPAVEHDTPPRRTGVDRPSTSWLFHWSNEVTRQSPGGSPVSVKVPSGLHLVKAKSSPSGSPTLM